MPVKERIVWVDVEKWLGRESTQNMLINRNALIKAKLVTLETGTPFFFCLPGVRSLWKPLLCPAHPLDHRSSQK